MRNKLMYFLIIIYCFGAAPARGGCDGRDWALRSRAIYSGCIPGGRCRSSCVLICCAAASARSEYK